MYNWYDGYKAKKLEVTESFKSVGIILPIADNAPVNAVASTLTTELDGDNNDLVFTAKTKGESGDNITITYVAPDDDKESESVVVNGTDIVVTLRRATDTLSTATQVKTAIEANDDAKALVTIANALGNNGEGNVTAMAKAPLSNGADGTVVPSAGIWYMDTSNIYITTAANTVADANWKKVALSDLSG